MLLKWILDSFGEESVPVQFIHHKFHSECWRMKPKAWDMSRPLLRQACGKCHHLIWRYTVLILTFSTSTSKCTRVKYNKIQFMIIFNSYIFRHHPQGVGLVFLCSARFLENRTPVPKHVGVWFLSRNVFYDLYFIVLYWVHLLVDVLNVTT